MRSYSRQTGFSLLEVLVALLVLSVGLIGLAGLQMTALQNSRDAYYRSQAVVLAYDITDRMRANLTAALAGDYDSTGGALNSSCRTTTGCSSTALAADDVKTWRDEVARILPSGQAIVCLDTSPDDGTGFATPACSKSGKLSVVKIWWNANRNPAAPEQRLVVPFIL